MYCSNCGTKVKDSHKYCISCGNKLSLSEHMESKSSDEKNKTEETNYYSKQS